MTAPWFLNPANLAGALPASEWAAFTKLGQAQRCRRHDLIFRLGEPADHVYLLRTGRVKIFSQSEGGRETILWFCFPGEVFGLAEITRGGQREVYAQACSDCEYQSIPQAEFKAFLADHPRTALAVIDLFSCRLRVLGDMLQALTADDATTRVVKLLLRLSARYGRMTADGVCLDIPLTHQEMADMVGTTRQTVTTILSDLKRSGVLRIERHQIFIAQTERLERMVRAVESMAPAATAG